jgi:hypothetical protein
MRGLVPEAVGARAPDGLLAAGAAEGTGARDGAGDFVLDAGCVDQALGEGFGVTGWTESATLLGEIGITPDSCR